MQNEILVVDIETTGFLKQGGAIVEIGIVKLNTETGEKTPAFNSIVKEGNFDSSHTKGRFGWIFQNSNLTYKDVESADSLEVHRIEIQELFDSYKATAFNKRFDFDFLLSRNFRIQELECIMLTACPIVNLPPNPGYFTPKWPKVEEAWNYFFGNTGYVEAHRGLDDAMHEADIAFELIKRGALKV